jgi:hypothetical protein
MGWRESQKYASGRLDGWYGFITTKYYSTFVSNLALYTVELDVQDARTKATIPLIVNSLGRTVMSVGDVSGWEKKFLKMHKERPPNQRRTTNEAQRRKKIVRKLNAISSETIPSRVTNGPRSRGPSADNNGQTASELFSFSQLSDSDDQEASSAPPISTTPNTSARSTASSPPLDCPSSMLTDELKQTTMSIRANTMASPATMPESSANLRGNSLLLRDDVFDALRGSNVNTSTSGGLLRNNTLVQDNHSALGIHLDEPLTSQAPNIRIIPSSPSKESRASTHRDECDPPPPRSPSSLHRRRSPVQIASGGPYGVVGQLAHQ